MESSGTFVLHACCTWVRVYNKKLKNKNLELFAKFCKKKNCSQSVRFCWPFAAGPTGTPPSIVGIASGQPADRPAASGHGAACCSWRRMHQVKMSAWLWVIWVIWVIWVTVLNCMAMHAIGSFGSFILHSQSDPKHGTCAPCWREVFGSFGSFGHRFKIGGWSGVGVAIQFTRYIPLYQNLNFP